MFFYRPELYIYIRPAPYQDDIPHKGLLKKQITGKITVLINHSIISTTDQIRHYLTQPDFSQPDIMACFILSIKHKNKRFRRRRYRRSNFRLARYFNMTKTIFRVCLRYIRLFGNRLY